MSNINELSGTTITTLNRASWGKHSVLLLYLVVTLSLCLVGCTHGDESHKTWRVYKGGPDANNYSALSQINQTNVQKLTMAWWFYPNDEPEGFRIWKYECNPIIIDSVMYLTSGWGQLYAIHAATGQELWTFDPLQGNRGGGVLRGVTYWSGEGEERIFFTSKSKLCAVDAITGSAIADFGNNGQVELAITPEGLETPLEVRVTTPGIIYRNLIIIGAAVSENAGAAPGYVRAYDIHSGELAWTFHTIPKPGEFGYDSWPPGAYKTAGGANNWAGMSLDEDRGIVYIPTGSPTYDYYGADRIGANLFGNCLLALNAGTGEYIWHFQTIHHDIWDYDLPTAPNLITVTHNGRKIDAVAQPSKMGFLYILNRETGIPIYPIEERPVPATDIPGEESWPTQPFPLKPEPFARQQILEKDLANYSNESYDANKQFVRELLFNGLFTPLGFKTTLLIPGSRGGGEWGGGAYDLETGIIYINSNESPELGRIDTVRSPNSAIKTLYQTGKELYQTYCASCHGENKQGVESNPSLIAVDSRLNLHQITEIINNGSGIMPSFRTVLKDQQDAILAFITETGKGAVASTLISKDTIITYTNAANKAYLVDSMGRPMISPPWGTLNAIDLNTGAYRWKIPLGSHPEFQQPNEPPTGMENYGGPVVTAGGLVFIAATMDSMFRAFDKNTGTLLWEVELPGNGLATPAVYSYQGKQYIAIAVSIGENFSHEKTGIIAFALSE